MVVLDLLCQDPHLTAVTLIEPDVYKLHNVARHYFDLEEVGEFKAELAEKWIKARRPDLLIELLICDVTDAKRQADINRAVAAADVGVCAVDNEPAKYHWDALMRRHGKPWTLGEVLSGGIGGFVHLFRPGGACYGCVAGFLQRSVEVEKSKAPDYSQPGGPAPEVTIPAGKAAIHAVAGLHAVLTAALLQDPGHDAGFTSLLLTLQRVPDLFDEAFRPHKFAIPRSADCLVCQPPPAEFAAEELDVALDQALARLGHA
jgi:molybdopterin/thiamine biosynthesis adenylyltransferase